MHFADSHYSAALICEDSEVLGSTFTMQVLVQSTKKVGVGVACLDTQDCNSKIECARQDIAFALPECLSLHCTGGTGTIAGNSARGKPKLPDQLGISTSSHNGRDRLRTTV